MIFRIFETPLIDILFMLLLVRILFPQLFIARKRKESVTRERIIIREKQSRPDSKDKQGEYIEYEEIK